MQLDGTNSGALRFISAMNVTRNGLQPDTFYRDLTPAQARNKLAKTGHSLCEFLQGTGLCTKLFLDRDVRLSPGELPTPERIASELRKVRDNVEAMLLMLKTDETNLSYRIATRHGVPNPNAPPGSKDACHKLSFRPFVLGLKMRYSEIPALICCAGQELFWDMTVYKSSEQLLASIGGCKGHMRDGYRDERILMPLSLSSSNEDELGQDIDLLDYVAQHVESDWLFLDLSPEFVKEQTGAADDKMSDAAPSGGDLTLVNQKDASYASAGSGACPPFVEALVACLSPHTASDREKWLRVAMVLRNEAASAQENIDVDEAYFRAWLAFSRKSTDKFQGESDCRKTWDSIKDCSQQQQQQRKVTLGSLCLLASQDNVDAYRKAQALNTKAFKGFNDFNDFKRKRDASTLIMEEDVSMNGINRDALATALQKLTLPSVTWAELGVNGGSGLTLTHAPPGDLLLTCKAFKGLLSPDLVFKTIVGEGPNKYIGALYGDLPIDLSMTFIHQGIPDCATFNFNRTSDRQGVFQAEPPHEAFKITWSNMDDERNGTSVLQVSMPDKVSQVTKKDKIMIIRRAVQTQIDLHAQRQFGITKQIFIGNLQVNINTLKTDDDGASEDQIADALIAARPDFFGRLRFVPEAEKDSCNGLYYCDPKTNIWDRSPNVVLQQKIVDELKRVPGITKKDLNRSSSVIGSGAIRKKLAGRCSDKFFEDRLDANLDVFAVKNGLFDTRDKTFRNIRMDDFVSTTTAWDYDPEKAKVYRPELDAFLEQVLPVAQERTVVLKYLASLLSGRRRIKKLLMFTDKRSGNNGKSTLCALLLQFFDRHAKTTAKFICKGTFDADRNSHDAGLQVYKGKRLVLAEELKGTQTLDLVVLKKYTGSENVIAEGRRFGSGNDFRFTWQGGFVLVFNEGDCPQFDAADLQFKHRMLVAPMRSKFVPEESLQQKQLELEPYTYAIDLEVQTRFPQWMSAFADLLMEHYDAKEKLSQVPDSMQEWCTGLANDANDISEWMAEQFVVTKDKTDVVLLRDMKEQYFGVYGPGNGNGKVNKKNFALNAKAYCATLDGVKFLECTTVASKSQGGVGVPRRDVFRGLRNMQQYMNTD